MIISVICVIISIFINLCLNQVVIIDGKIELSQGTNYYFDIKSNIQVINGEKTSVGDLDKSVDFFNECKILESQTLEKNGESIVADKIDCSSVDMSKNTVLLTMSSDYRDTIIFTSLLEGSMAEVNVYASLILSLDNNFVFSETVVMEYAKLMVSAYFGSMKGSDITILGYGYFDAFEGDFTNVSDNNSVENGKLKQEIRVRDENEEKRKKSIDIVDDNYKKLDLQLIKFNPPIRMYDPLMGERKIRRSFTFGDISANSHIIFSGNNKVTNSTFIYEVSVIGGNSSFKEVNVKNLILDGQAIGSKDLYDMSLESCNVEIINSLDYSITTNNVQIVSLEASGIGTVSFYQTNLTENFRSGTNVDIKNSTVTTINYSESNTATYFNIKDSTIGNYHGFSNNADVLLENLDVTGSITFESATFSGNRIPTFTLDNVRVDKLTTSCKDSCSIHATFVFQNMKIPVSDGDSLFVTSTDETTGETNALLKYSPSGTSFIMRNCVFQNDIHKLKVDLNNIYKGNLIEISDCNDFDAAVNLVTDYSNSIYGIITHNVADVGYDSVILRNVNPVSFSIKYLNDASLNNSIDKSNIYSVDDGLVIELENMVLLNGIDLTHRNVHLSMKNSTIYGNIIINTYNSLNILAPITVENVVVSDNFTFNGGCVDLDGNYGNTNSKLDNLSFSLESGEELSTNLVLSIRNGCASLTNIKSDNIDVKCSTSEFTEKYIPSDDDNGEEDKEEMINTSKYLFQNITTKIGYLQGVDTIDIKDITSDELTLKVINAKCSIRNVGIGSSELLTLGLYDSNCQIANIDSRNVSIVLVNSEMNMKGTDFSQDNSSVQPVNELGNLSVLLSESSSIFDEILVHQFKIDSKYSSTISISNSTIYNLLSSQFFDTLTTNEDGRGYKLEAFDNTSKLTISKTSIQNYEERSFGNSSVFLDHAHINKSTEKIVVGGIGKRTVYHGSSSFGPILSAENTVTMPSSMYSPVQWDYENINSFSHYSDYIPRGIISEKLSTIENYVGTHSFDSISSFLSYKNYFIGPSNSINALKLDGLIEYVTLVDETTITDNIVVFFGSEFPRDKIGYLNSSETAFLSEGLDRGDMFISVVPFIDPLSTSSTTNFSIYENYVHCSIEVLTSTDSTSGNNGKYISVGCINDLASLPDDDPLFNNQEISKKAVIYGMVFVYVPKKGNLPVLDYYIHSRHVDIKLDTTSMGRLNIDTLGTVSKLVDINISGGYYKQIIISDEEEKEENNSIPELRHNISIEFVWFNFQDIEENDLKYQPLDINTSHKVNISVAQRLYKKFEKPNSEEEENAEVEELAESGITCLAVNYISADGTPKNIMFVDYATNNASNQFVSEMSLIVSEDSSLCNEENTAYGSIKAGGLVFKVANTMKSALDETDDNVFGCSIDVTLFENTERLTLDPWPFVIGESDNDSRIELMATGFFFDYDVDGEFWRTSIVRSVTPYGQMLYTLAADGQELKTRLNISKKFEECTIRFSNKSNLIMTKLSGYLTGFDFGLITFSGRNYLSLASISAVELIAKDVLNFRALNLKSSCKVSVPKGIDSINYVTLGSNVVGVFDISHDGDDGIVLYTDFKGNEDNTNISDAEFKVRKSIRGNIVPLQDDSCDSKKNINVNIEIGGNNSFIFYPHYTAYLNPATSSVAITLYVFAGIIVVSAIIVVIVCMKKKHKKCSKLIKYDDGNEQSDISPSLINTSTTNTTSKDMDLGYTDPNSSYCSSEIILK